MDLSPPVLFAFGVLLGLVLGAIWVPVIAGGRWAASSLFSYHKQRYLLSAAERTFYTTLYEAVGADWRILSKVRLVDLVRIKRGTQRWLLHFNRIAIRHVDFVLYPLNGRAPALVIELDDTPHWPAGQHGQSASLDSILESAKLPILHIPARTSYQADELALLVREKIYATRNSGPLGDYLKKEPQGKRRHPELAFGKLKQLVGTVISRRVLLLAFVAVVLVAMAAPIGGLVGASPSMAGSAPTVPQMEVRVAADAMQTDSTGRAQNAALALPPASPTGEIAPTATLTPTGPTATLTTGLNLRPGPGTRYPPIEVLAGGARVMVLGKDATGGWLKVTTSEGRAGWMSAGYLKVAGSLDDVPVASTP